MKKLLTIALTALLFASCTKETAMMKPSKDVHGMKLTLFHASFSTDWSVKTATLTYDGKEIEGEWVQSSDFRNPAPEIVDLDFSQVDPQELPLGTIRFQCRFSGAKKDGLEYTGTGSWFIESSDGTLAYIKNGAGNLSYRAEETIFPDMVQVNSFADLSGYTR